MKALNYTPVTEQITLASKSFLFLFSTALLPGVAQAVTYTDADFPALSGSTLDIDPAPSTGGTILNLSSTNGHVNLEFTGTGTLTYTGSSNIWNGNGNSTFTGDVFLDSNQVRLQAVTTAQNFFGNTANQLYSTAATLNFYDGYSSPYDIEIESNVRFQPATTGATGVQAGNVTVAGAHTLTLGNGFNSADRNMTISGDITDAGLGANVTAGNQNSTFTLSGNNNYTGLTRVTSTGALLNLDGTHTGGNFRVDGGGTLGGSGTILFQDGMGILVDAGGTLDLTDLTSDLSAITTSGTITIADYTDGTLLNAPTNLQDVLVGSPGWTLTDTGTALTAVIPEPSSIGLITGALALAGVVLRRR